MLNPPKSEVLTVGQLNGQIRETLQDAFGAVWVAGEITDLSRPGSGHLYFALKDPSGTIKAVVWRTTASRLGFEPEDGMQVLCRGNVDVYAPRGTYQLIVQQMQTQGEGALQAALKKLRAKLEAEGLFAAVHKRPLPAFPKRIAVVTSPSGAALRDFLEVVRRRWSDCQIIVVPTRVQGLDVGREIAKAIRLALRINPLVDAILITRGGGSLQDLWGFNDEVVVRAIYNSSVPVVSAVGHEIDVTLSDLVADVRALTPTEAGELLVPDASEWMQRLKAAEARITALARARCDHARSRLNSLAEARVVRDPYGVLRERERMLDELQQRATLAMRHQADKASSRLVHFADQLTTLSPLQVLSRGYSLTQRADGRIVRAASELNVDDEIYVRLSKGRLSAIVKAIDGQPDSVDSMRRGRQQSTGTTADVRASDSPLE